MNDALAIARWCWPDENWHLCGDEPRTQDEIAFVDSEHDNADGCYAVADAEAVLIERGHDEAYGKALAKELDPYSCLLLAFRSQFTTAWSMLATIATAPLDARIRAMAAVIRTLEPK